jgi:hypothetical protein
MEKSEDKYTTISIKKSVWKKLTLAKIQGDYASFDDLLSDLFRPEDLALAREKKALKQNK